MFSDNYKRLAKSNSNFRQVLYTGPHSQVVAMSLLPNEDIGEEIHENNDQIFIIASGNGEAKVGNETKQFEKKELIFVPAGTSHNISNTGKEDLKLITIYAPPNHPDGTIHATKKDAQASER